MGDDSLDWGDYFSCEKVKDSKESKMESCGKQQRTRSSAAFTNKRTKADDFGFVEACGTTSANRLHRSSSNNHDEYYADDDDHRETTISPGASTSIVTTTTTTNDTRPKFFNVTTIGGLSGSTAPKEVLKILSHQHKKEMDVNTFEEIVTNSVQMFYPTNSRTTKCGFLNEMYVRKFD